MPSSTRWVVVDDSSPRVNYTTPDLWSARRGDQGLTGLPFNNTLHAADASRKTASLSISFTGTGVDVYCVNNFLNVSRAVSPVVECLIDNIKSITTAPSLNGNIGNNWVLCSQPRLEDKLHTVSINVYSNEPAFLFDRIQYLPSSGSSMENQTIYISNQDLSITYGPGWEGSSSWYSYTSKTNTTWDFEFTGVSLQWYGVTPMDSPEIPTTASYTIDGGSPQVVALPGRVNSPPNVSLQHQKYFETTTLPMGKHKVSVVYNGDSNTTPLTLDYLIIQNGSLPYTPPPPDTHTPNNNNKIVEKRPKDIGPIVGGVLAAIAVLALIAGLFFYFRRRSLSAAKRAANRNTSTNEVVPFDVRASRAISTTNSKSQLTSPSLSDLPPGSHMPPWLKGSQEQNYDEELAQVQVLRHQDSGLRRFNESQRTTGLEEIPPEYTPG